MSKRAVISFAAAVAVVLAAIITTITLATGDEPAPASALAGPNPATPPPPSPTVVLDSSVTGVIDPGTVADPVIAGYLYELNLKGVKYPNSYAAMLAGNGAAPSVCAYYGEREGRRDGRLIIEMTEQMPDWAQNTPFVQVVAATLCDGTRAR